MMSDVATEPRAGLRDRTIEEFIYTSSMRLDAKDFKGWLDTCLPEFTYAIRTFSHEIRKDVVWLEHDYDGMAALVRQLPRHNTDQSEFTRHATVYTIVEGAAETVVVTAVAIYRTTLDGGETKLFAIGRYTDALAHTVDGWRFRSRDLRLETRSLGIGTHYPL
jgi:methanesulfonate monooxygenase small subunit